MERWEHMTVRNLGSQLGVMTPDGQVTFPSGLRGYGGIQQLLNELGREGWQLVSVEPSEGTTYWLKRPLA